MPQSKTLSQKPNQQTNQNQKPICQAVRSKGQDKADSGQKEQKRQRHGTEGVLSSCSHRTGPPHPPGDTRSDRQRRDGGKPSLTLFLLAGAWVQVSPSPELREGQAVVLSCQVPTGVPEGTSYRWFQDGRPLQESTSSILRIAAISLRQAGAYHCQAQAPDTATASLAAPVSLHVSCKGVSHWGRERAVFHSKALYEGCRGSTLTTPHLM